MVVAWIYLCSLHWHNDGLWFQGDAPRHAANGLFWKDYLLSLSPDPKGYALAYYARYPIINPTAYPPLFYLLEGACFGLFGASPYVGKALVLLAALAASLYTTAWLRRWVAGPAGWLGAIIPLLPGVVLWSHALMLNVPSFALGLAALYHARRWLEAPAARQAVAAAVFTLLAVLTYYPAGAVVFVMAAWALALRRGPLTPTLSPGGRGSHTSTLSPGGRGQGEGGRVLAATAAAGALLVPCILVGVYWAPTHVRYVFPTAEQVWTVANWTYYPSFLYQLVSPHLMILAAVGAAGGLLSRRWRRETALLLGWLAIYYALFSYLAAKESRYVLAVCVPFMGLCAIALCAAADTVGSLAPGRPRLGAAVLAAGVAGVLGVQTWLAGRQWVPSQYGFREAVAFLEEVAPAEPILYDGYYDGVFTFHVQAGDPDFRRRVVLGSKLLYAQALVPGWHLREFASTPEEVLEVLRTRGGCRWLAVEHSERSDEVAPARLLRQAILGAEFEFVRSFPIATLVAGRIDVYRLLVPVEHSEEVELPFPILGDVRYKVRPIQR